MKALAFANIPAVIAEYNKVVRANMSDDWDTIAAVAECTDGIYGVLGEVWDTANRLGFTLDDDDVTDALQDAAESYQAILRSEVAAR